MIAPMLEHRDISLDRGIVEGDVLTALNYQPKMGKVKARKLGVKSKIFFIKRCRIMGIDQLTLG